MSSWYRRDLSQCQLLFREVRQRNSEEYLFRREGTESEEKDNYNPALWRVHGVTYTSMNPFLKHQVHIGKIPR